MFALLNVQGLIGKRFDKLQSPELKKKLVASNDVIMLTETWTNDLSCVDVEGYKHFVLNRNIMSCKHPNAKRDSSGLIVYMKNYLVCRDTLVKMVALFGLNSVGIYLILTVMFMCVYAIIRR